MCVMSRRIFTKITSFVIAFILLIPDFMGTPMVVMAAKSLPDGWEEVVYSDLTCEGAWSPEGTTQEIGASAEYTFEGRQVSLIAPKGPDMGKVKIYINGTFASEIDLYAPGMGNADEVFKSDDLGENVHTIRIVSTGDKNVSSLGTKVTVRAVWYRELTGESRLTTVSPTDPLITYGENGWEDIGNLWDLEADSNAIWTQTKGAYIEYDFIGTGVGWNYGGWFGRGKADVYVDGEFQECVNTDTGWDGNKWWEKTGLPSATHTLRVVYVGGGDNDNGGMFFDSIKYFDETWKGETRAKATLSKLTLGGLPEGWFKNDDSVRTRHEGMYFEYNFDGTSISWLGSRNKDRTKAKVTVYREGDPSDVIDEQIVDQYALSGTGIESIYQSGVFVQGNYTIRVEALAEKNEGSIADSACIISNGLIYGSSTVLQSERKLDFKAYGGGSIHADVEAGIQEVNSNINISATSDSVHTFDRWYALNGEDNMFGDINDAETVFTMPDRDVTIVAVFCLPDGNQYSYDPLPSMYMPSDTTMTVNGYPIQVYEYMDRRMVRFQMPEDQPVTITITQPDQVKRAAISPAAYHIPTTISENSFTFTMDSPLKIRININGEKQAENEMYIFADPLEKNAPTLSDVNVISVMEFIEPSGTHYRDDNKDEPDPNDGDYPLRTKMVQAAIDYVHDNSDGIDTLYFPNGVYRVGTIYIKSNVNVYLANAAIVLGPTESGRLEEAYHYPPDQPQTTGWIQIKDSENIKIFGRGILDANGTYLYQNNPPVMLEGGQSEQPPGRGMLLSLQGMTEMPLFRFHEDGSFAGFTVGGRADSVPDAEAFDSNRKYVGWDKLTEEQLAQVETNYGTIPEPERTQNICVEDVYMMNAWGYQTVVDSCNDVIFYNTKAHTPLHSGSRTHEIDGFKICSSNNVTYDNGWLMATDDTITLAANGPTAKGDCYNNVIKNTVFCSYNAGYVRFAFAEHGYSYFDNLVSNIYVMDSPSGWEAFKGTNFPGYRFDTAIGPNIWEDFFIEGKHTLLELGFSNWGELWGWGGIPGFIGFEFNRITIDSVNQGTIEHNTEGSPLSVKFTDLIVNGEYVEDMQGAGLVNEGSADREIIFEITDERWVDVNPESMAIYYSQGWTNRSNNAAGDRTANGSGEVISYTFTGTDVQWMARGSGMVDVYVDGKLQESGVTASSGYTVEKLNNSRHTIMISTKDGSVTNEGFRFYRPKPAMAENWVEAPHSDTGIVYNGNWSIRGGNKETNTLADSFEYELYGDTVKVRAYKGPDMGKANLYINGRLVQTIDLYEPVATSAPRLVYESDLWGGHHNIKLVHTGEKNSASSGTTIGFSSLEYNNSPEWVSVAADDGGMYYTGGWNVAENNRETTTEDDSFEYKFLGGGVRWIGSGSGTAEVYIDGNLKEEVTLDTSRNTLFEVTDLSQEGHTIEVKFTSGTELVNYGIMHLSPQWITVDFDDESIVYEPSRNNWDKYSDFRQTKVEGRSFEFTFTGTAVAWRSNRNTNRAIADVYVDDIFEGQVDTYSPFNTALGRIFQKTDLQYGQHTLKIVHSGEINPDADPEGQLANHGVEYVTGDNGPPWRVVTRANGGTVTIAEPQDNYASGTKLSISAVPAKDYQFTGWVALNGGIFDNVKNANTTFTMPNGDVTLIAQFEAVKNPATDPAVQNVVDLINKIGNVEYTSTSKSKIDAAKAAYNALSKEQKALVLNYTTLSAAVVKYEKLEAEAKQNTKKDISKATLGKINSQVYTGKVITPSVKVSHSNTALVKDKDYTISYSTNKNIGTAKVTIKGKGNYQGKITTTFAIVMKKGKTYTIGNYKYKVTNANTNGKGTVSIIGIKSKTLGSITVSDTVKIGGKTFKITVIGSSAFKNCKNVTSVTIGKNISTIQSSAFRNCTKLKKVTIKSTVLKKVEKQAFKGISGTATIKVPKSKLNAYRKLLSNKGQGSKVKIIK